MLDSDLGALVGEYWLVAQAPLLASLAEAGSDHDETNCALLVTLE